MPRLQIKELAQAKKLKLAGLARLSGQSYVTLSRYWHNQGFDKNLPLNQIQLSTLGEIARALGVKTGDLIVDE